MKNFGKRTGRMGTQVRSWLTFFRRGPSGLLGGLALIGLIESQFFGHEQNRTVDIASTWQWSQRSVVEQSRDCRIFCFGDSLVKFGVVPRIIEGRTGLPACNLAVFEGRPATSYLLLKTALDRGAQPAAIVMDNSLMYQSPVEHPAVWTEIASPSEAIKLAWLGKNASFLARYILSYHLASVRYRDGLRSELMASLQGVETRDGLIHRLNERNWTFNRGAAIIPSDLFVRDPAPKQLDHSMITKGIWLCHPINECYNNKFLELAKSRDILVFWLLPPTHPELARRLDRPIWNGRQEQFLRDLQERFPNLIVIDGTRADYDSTVMGDLVHMNRRGACAYSSSLGLIINDQLKSQGKDKPRWIKLPPFQEVLDPPVEDTTQSFEKIQAS